MLEEVLKKLPEERHSYFQLQHFVIGKEPTLQSKMWQCLKELQIRKENIDSLKIEIEDLQDDLGLTKLKIEKLGKEPEEEIIKRKLKRSEVKINNNIEKLKKRLKYINQEMNFILQLYKEYEKIEPVKDFDDYEAQKEYWEAKVSEELNLSMIFKQGFNLEVIKTALSLDDDSSVKNEINKLINHYMFSLDKKEMNASNTKAIDRK